MRTALVLPSACAALRGAPEAESIPIVGFIRVDDCGAHDCVCTGEAE